MTGRFDEAGRGARGGDRPGRRLAPAAAARASLVRLLVRLRTGDAEGWRARTPSNARSLRRSRCSRQRGTRPVSRWRGGFSPGRRARPAASAMPPTHRRARSSTRSARATSARSAAPRPRMQAPRCSGRPTSTRRSPAARRRSSRRPATASRKGTSSRSSATLYAMQGAFDHARDLVDRGRALLRGARSRQRRRPASTSRRGAWRCSRATSTEPSVELRRAYDALDARRREVPPLDVAGCSPRRCSSATRRSTRSRRSASSSRELATDDDVDTQALWRCVRGARSRPPRARSPRRRHRPRGARQLSSRRTRRCSSSTRAAGLRRDPRR